MAFNLKQTARRQNEINMGWLASLGNNHAQRVDSINAIYEERRATLVGMTFFSINLRNQLVMNSTSLVGLAHISFVVSRNLAGVDNREREYMRIIELLNSAAEGREQWYNTMRVALLLGDGKGIRSEWQSAGSTRYHGNFKKTVSEVFGTVDQAINHIQQHIAYLDQRPNLSPAYRAIVDEAKGSITPSGGNAWLKPS